jgi:hypothetical protein
VVSVQARETATVLAIEKVSTDIAPSMLITNSEANSEAQVHTSTAANDETTAEIIALTTDTEKTTLAATSGNYKNTVQDSYIFLCFNLSYTYPVGCTIREKLSPSKNIFCMVLNLQLLLFSFV